MAEQLTVNKIKDHYIAYMNAHYVSDEDARRIKDEFDRLRAENAKLRELCHDLRKEYAYLRARPRRFYVQHEARMAVIDASMRELGIEVD